MKPRRFESDTMVSSSATAGATSSGSPLGVGTGIVSADTRPWQGRAGWWSTDRSRCADPLLTSTCRAVSFGRSTDIGQSTERVDGRHRVRIPRRHAMTTATLEPTTIDPSKLEAFVGQALGELGATLNAALVVMGDQLGLYRAMAGAGPITAADLAQRTGAAERYVREWLNAQAAGGYVTYDPAGGTYTLP